MRKTKFFGGFLSLIVMSALCVLPAAAAEDNCNAYQEPYFTYTELDSTLQNTAPSWNLYRVSNTSRGIMIRIANGEGGTGGIFNGPNGSAIDTSTLQFCKQSVDDTASPYYTMTKARSYGKYGLMLGAKHGAGFLDPDCRNGRAYRYKAFYQASDGSYAASNEVTIFRLNQPKMTRTTPTKKTITVQWKQNTRATGYELQYARNRQFTSGKHTKKLSNGSTTVKKLRGLKSNKTYYVRVRSYKTSDGITSLSAWSAPQTVKTKK